VPLDEVIRYTKHGVLLERMLVMPRRLPLATCRGNEFRLAGGLAGAVLVTAVLGLGLATGCTHFIKQDSTPYFVDGPHQLEPPNGELAAGTGVWIIGEEDTYKRVWTLDGVIAYVWQGDVVTRSEWKQMQKERKEQAEREAQPFVTPGEAGPGDSPQRSQSTQGTTE
jgi:hypothetical protein